MEDGVPARRMIIWRGRFFILSRITRGIYQCAFPMQDYLAHHETSSSLPKNFAIGSSATARDLL